MQILINTNSYPLTERLMAFIDHYFEKYHMSNYALWLKHNNGRFLNSTVHRLHTHVVSVYQIIRALKEMTRWLQEMMSEYEYELYDKTSDRMFKDMMSYMYDINMYDMMLRQIALKCESEDEFKKMDLYFTQSIGRGENQFSKEHFNELLKNFIAGNEVGCSIISTTNVSNINRKEELHG